MEKFTVLFKNKKKTEVINNEKSRLTDWNELLGFCELLSKDINYVEDPALTEHLKKQGASVVKVLSVNEKNLCFKDISSSYWSHLGIKESEKTNKLIMREYQKNIVH